MAYEDKTLVLRLEGVLLGNRGRGVPSGSPIPDPIADQNMLFSTPMFQTWPLESMSVFRPAAAVTNCCRVISFTSVPKSRTGKIQLNDILF